MRRSRALFCSPEPCIIYYCADVPQNGVNEALKICGIPIKYSDTPAAIHRHPPLVGEHTEVILKDVLGCDEEGVERLRGKGVV